MKKISPIKALIVILALTFLIHQLVSSLYKPITTETAKYFTSNDGFDITGIVIRNEQLVKSKRDGVLHFLTEDGSRVAKDGVIANIYSSETSSIILSDIATVEKKIKNLKDVMSINNVAASNLDAANFNVSKALNSLILSSAYGDYNNIPNLSEELLSNINRRKALLGETSSFSEQLKSLNDELSNYKNSLQQPISKIKANQSGYFLSVTDGYETVLDIKDLSTITPDFLDKLNKKENDASVIGKIVSDYEWYISAKMTLNQSLNFKEGDALTIYTSLKSAPQLPVTVKKINISKDGTNAVIVFACNNMNSELASMRTGPMTVVNHEYSGLKIPKKSLRVVDSVRGVYVVNGMQVKFVPVEIVHSTDEYIICKKSENDGELRLYDQVVVRGKNLYDGKIIG
ncbi:MAG: hypothetical protein E7537_01240 [Ruminococcaceae bacterium]|nr:hypothetical protein [Oscillospiraceae bacterium]